MHAWRWGPSPRARGWPWAFPPAGAPLLQRDVVRRPHGRRTTQSSPPLGRDGRRIRALGSALFAVFRSSGRPFALVTNPTSRTRASIAERLAGAGFPVTVDDILTAPAVTTAYLRERAGSAKPPRPAASRCPVRVHRGGRYDRRRALPATHRTSARPSNARRD
ncbi:hypothetical protein [Streptomyces sp. NPDC060366]|uniref:hypothetical protein n=1 Tax=Streptomyces sp. NPDC060366 TaxID=3347105 RepID=UPI00364FDB2A